MNVTECFGLDAAPSCKGHVVVIDVLRACTTAAFAFGAGAARIVVVATADEAFALRRRDSAVVLVGEQHGQPIPGFDHGNSPAALTRLDLTGATVVLRSSNGAQGVVCASAADAVLLGSFPVAAATVRLLRRSAEMVSLLAVGSQSGLEGDGAEDSACSAYLAAHLRGEAPTPDTALEIVASSRAAAMAHDATVDWISPADLACASMVDCFDFAMVARRREGQLIVGPERF